MSYAHIDDDDGRLSEFREKLSAQARKLIGESFPIFQDCEDIKWGQEWEARIDESLAEVTFFIPIITPSFFLSQYCRDELARFLEREERLGLKLILPVYYIETPLIKDKSKRSSDELSQKISSRQYADCRDLCIEEFDSQKVRRLIFDLAAQIRDAMDGLPAKMIDHSLISSPTPNTTGPLINSQKYETLHRNIVVDKTYHGNYATISEAIEAATPGDIILVRPGLYNEGLVIDKPLEIVGEGERDEILIQAKGKSTLLFDTTSGRVANLTLRQIGEGEGYGVEIAQGRLTLEDCDISSLSRSSVSIHNDADPHLRGNKIHDSKRYGVYVHENGRGILEENDIFGNTYSGVNICSGGFLFIRRNRINRNESNAICILNGGGGVIEDNDMRDNERGAWSLESLFVYLKVKRARNLE